MNISDLHFRVCDNGIFLPVARALAKTAGRVSYYSHDGGAYQTIRECGVGVGFPDIERVPGVFDDWESVDCWCFPDINFRMEEAVLRSMVKPVFGAGNSQLLETNRGAFLEALASAGLKVPPHKVIHGIEPLKHHLRDKRDKWIKVSKLRGDWETLHWRDWQLDWQELLVRELRLGPFGEDIDFYVFDKIEAEVEDGMDAWFAAGQWPKTVLHGMEAKDRGYLITWADYADLPEPLRSVHDAFGEILKAQNYRGPFSSEVRITKDGTPYFTDPTCRFGSPPSQSECEMIGNLAEIVWAAANGEMVEAEQAHQFGVQALVSAKGNRRAWTTVPVGDGLDQWLKCGFCAMKDGALQFPPTMHSEENSEDIGWLLGVGDTIQEALDHLHENIKLLPDGVTCETSALGELLKEVQEAEAEGMKFTDQEVPEPEAALPKE